MLQIVAILQIVHNLPRRERFPVPHDIFEPVWRLTTRNQMQVVGHDRIGVHLKTPDGFVDLEKAGTLTCSGLDSYHKTARIARLSYAKPDQVPLQIADF
jgi:hypothetical protein